MADTKKPQESKEALRQRGILVAASIPLIIFGILGILPVLSGQPPSGCLCISGILSSLIIYVIVSRPGAKR
jgi:hypothetical protein